MFERVTRSSGDRRWHLDRCGVWVYGDAVTQSTADVEVRDLCMRCARSALREIAAPELDRPHGQKIVAAARRYMSPPQRPR
jgi:hypothetical protein